MYHPFVGVPLGTARMLPIGSTGVTDLPTALLLVTPTLPVLSTAWMNHSTVVPTSGPAPLHRDKLRDISALRQAPLSSL